MEQENSQTSEPSHIPWHSAFVEVLRLELERYEDVLEIIPEFHLTSGPLQIDVLVIKKTTDAPIDKNIARIFRSDNIVEYKSPGDYISTGDFYKVYGYACFYAYLQKAPITGITLTFVESHYPRELIAHLREVRGYTVEEKMPGIYTINGDILPVQVIDSRKLSEDENLWLKGLSDRLDPAAVNRIALEIRRQGKAARISAFLYAITHANAETIREAIKMGRSAVTFDQVMEEAGFAAKWEARGEARGEVRGEVRGEAKGEARKTKQFIELLKSAKSKEELLKLLEESI